MLNLDNVGFCRNHRWILQHIQITFAPGQFWGLIGPNGSGKSTLLRLMSGELIPSEGDLQIDGTSIRHFTPLQLARHRAFLSQKSLLQFPFTVEEVVQFGRYSQTMPQREAHNTTRSHPLRHITPQQAMQEVHVEALATRLYTTLSGGEACRVDLARIFAQQTPILLLDEPTNHLDPRHQVAILSRCRKWAQEGALVIAALHDLNLAAQYTDSLMMLQDGKLVAHGAAQDVLCPQRLAQVYDIPFALHHTSTGRPFVIPESPTKETTDSMSLTNQTETDFPLELR